MSAENIYARPVLDPVVWERFKAYREKYGYFSANNYFSHDRGKTRIEAWANAHGIDRYSLLSKPVEFELDGFHVKVHSKYDESPDDLGPKHTDKGQPVHLGQSRNRTWVGEHKIIDGVRKWVREERPFVHRDNVQYNGYDRFHGNDEDHRRYREYRWVVGDETYNGYFDGLWWLGYSKAECDLRARKYWLEDINRVEKRNSDRESAYGILVDVSYDVSGSGDRIELANESTWGIWSDEDAEYFVSVAYDIFTEAMAAAKHALPGFLKKVRGETKRRSRILRVHPTGKSAKLRGTGLVK